MRFTGDPQIELAHTELDQHFNEKNELITTETLARSLFILISLDENERRR